MSISTAVSRITGFVRTWAMGVAMGVTLVSSSYVVANNIPNMVYELVAGGALSAMFIPLFIERLQDGGEDDAWRFASSVLNLSMIVLGLVALAGTIWAEPFVRTQTFRISAEKAAVATYFFRFFAVQVVFYGLFSIFMGILNAKRRFLAPAVAPIFNNLVVIVTLLGFYLPFHEKDPRLAVAGLAIGTTLGVVVMAALQVPALWRLGMRYKPVLDLRHPAIRKMTVKTLPILAYVAANMVTLSVRNAYSFAADPARGPAALTFAWMWYQLPYGIFAVALATAIFPELSDDAAARDWSRFKSHFSRGFRATGILIIPLSLLMAALAVPVTSLYRAGSFLSSDVSLVAPSLRAWALGLFSFAAFMFVLRTFYSLQDSRTPMLTNFVFTVVHIGLYAVLTVGLVGWKGLGLVGIPIADGVTYTLHAVVLWLILRSRIGGMDGRETLSRLLRVTLAAAAGAAASYGVWLGLRGLSGSLAGFLGAFAAAGLAGLGVAYGLAALFRVPEMAELRPIAERAMRLPRPPAPEGEE